MEKQEAVLIKTDGSKTDITPKNGSDFSLEELYELIGCEMVEVVYLTDSGIMIIDEEGKQKKPIVMNRIATDIANLPGDIIVGNVVVCHTSMFK